MALELILITHTYMELNRDRDDLSLEERRRGDKRLSDEEDACEHTTSKGVDPTIPSVIFVRRKKRRTNRPMIRTPASKRSYNSHHQRTDELIKCVKVLINNQREQQQMLQSCLATFVSATRYMEKSMKRSKKNKKRKKNQTSESNLSIDSSDSSDSDSD